MEFVKESSLSLTAAGGNNLNGHVAGTKGVSWGGVVVALVKSQPNRGVAPMTKAVKDQVAAIMDFLTDFEGSVSNGPGRPAGRPRPIGRARPGR